MFLKSSVCGDLSHCNSWKHNQFMRNRIKEKKKVCFGGTLKYTEDQKKRYVNKILMPTGNVAFQNLLIWNS